MTVVMPCPVTVQLSYTGIVPTTNDQVTTMMNHLLKHSLHKLIEGTNKQRIFSATLNSTYPLHTKYKLKAI
jgi:hypothetical protein